MRVKVISIFLLFRSIFFIPVSAQVTGLSGWNIFLDPGHSQTENMGIYGYSEAEKNLRVGLRLKEMLLEETDIDTVYISRTNDQEYVTLSQRTSYANSLGAAWFHSFHSDAGSPQSNSTLLLWGQLYDGTPDPPVGGEDMSDIMVDILTRGIRTTSRGSQGDCSFYSWTGACTSSWPGPYLWVNRMSNMPSELSEAGFHTNPRQNQLNMNANWKKLEARTFYWSILKHHEIDRPTARICTGIISNLESGTPINGAIVKLGSNTDTTDTFESLFHLYTNDPDLLHNGFYYFEGLSDDTFQMVVEAENYYSDTIQVTLLDTFFTFVDVQLISTLPPHVVFTNPTEGDTNFPAWDPIVIDFSRSMDQTSVETTFEIIPEVNGQFLWNDEGTRMIFFSDTLQFETGHTLTISGDARDQYGHFFDGNSDGIGGDDFILTFTTGPPDMAPPVIISTYPGMNALDIELNPIINIRYNEVLDLVTVTDSIYVLERYSDDTEVSGIFKHYIVKKQSVFCFFPEEELLLNEVYVSRIPPGLKDLFGNEVTIWKSFPFRTADYTYNITLIDNFESGISNWWQPQQSGSTTGIITDSTGKSVNSTIVNLLTGSTQSLQLDYGWDTNTNYWLIREYLSGGAPQNVWFDSTYILQVYIIGDGSGNQFRFCVDDNVPDYTAGNHEVSPWYTIDWIGWKLVSWDMTNDGTGTWIGDGNLDGTLRFDSIQLTYNPGSSEFGTFYFDDLQLAKVAPLSVADGPELIPDGFVLHQNYPNPFNPVTTLSYELPLPAHVTLTIYDVLGREVRSWYWQRQTPGVKSIVWDATDNSGYPVGAGMYLLRWVVRHGSSQNNIYQQTRKMIYIR